MKKLVITLGVLLMVSSGMAYAGGYGGEVSYGASCCGAGPLLGTGYGASCCCGVNASCCAHNSTTLPINSASCCAPGGSNFSQRNLNPAPMVLQNSVKN